jgi:FKBP-type peptidyl-prolyl cis-trans isomerase FklB
MAVLYGIMGVHLMQWRRMIMFMRVCVLLAFVLVSAAVQAADSEFKTDKERFSYAVGVQIGGSLQRDGLDVDGAIIGQAISDVLSKSSLRMSAEQMQTAITTFKNKKAKEMQALAEANLKKGKAFLNKHRKEKGVKELDNGIQYKILTKGKGKKPSPTDTVVVDYRGKLIDGTEFDSSYKRGQPATFAVNAVIQGWQEVLPLMPVGSKWEVVIPSDLAYGPRGTGGVIGPNDTLVFEIELKDIKSPAK